MFKIFPWFYTAVPILTYRNLILKEGRNRLKKISSNDITSGQIQSRPYTTGKGKGTGKKPGKEEEVSLKMPGFVSPETLKEEGYFTQKAQEQLEELKKRGFEKPKLTNPEKNK